MHLNNSRVYLAGPIDHDPTDGMDWRQDMGRFLNEMGVLILDPTNKAIYNLGDKIPEEIGAEKAYYKKLKEAGSFDRLSELAKIIRHIDLRMTDIADFLVIKLDPNIMMCGTWEELFNANRQKKPILIWMVGGKKAAPLWLFGTIDHKYIFESLDDIKAYIQKINSGEIEMDGRWTLLDHNRLTAWSNNATRTV